MKEAETVSHHYSEYSQRPDEVLEIPGLATISGIFSEFDNGYSILFTTDEGFYIAASFNRDAIVRIYNVTRLERKKFSLGTIRVKREDRWANAIKGVFNSFNKMGYNLKGLNITLMGKALLSDDRTLTALLIVSCTVLINNLFLLGLSRKQMKGIISASNEFLKYIKARKRDMDILFDQENGCVHLYDERTSIYQSYPFPFLKDSIYEVSFFSPSLPPSLISSVYREIEGEVKDAVDIIASLTDIEHFKSLSERELKDFITRIRVDKRDIVSFIYKEERLTKAIWESIKNRDIELFSSLLMEYQEALSEEAGVSSPEIDWLFKRAKAENGVLLLCSLYTGYGGDMVAIMAKGHNTPYKERLEEYEKIFGFKPKYRKLSLSKGIRAICIDEDSAGK